MSKEGLTDVNLVFLIGALASKDGLTRSRARQALVVLGLPAVPALIRALRDPKRDQLRWEAAKALGAIRDARAAPALVRALEDDDPDVAWLAAEALEQLGQAAWPPLLHALIERGAVSAALRQGAHHVFRHQREEGFEHLIALLLKALESETVPEMPITAAHRILETLEAQARRTTRAAAHAGKAVPGTP